MSNRRKRLHNISKFGSKIKLVEKFVKTQCSKENDNFLKLFRQIPIFVLTKEFSQKKLSKFKGRICRYFDNRKIRQNNSSKKNNNFEGLQLHEFL